MRINTLKERLAEKLGAKLSLLDRLRDEPELVLFNLSSLLVETAIEESMLTDLDPEWVEDFYQEWRGE